MRINDEQWKAIFHQTSEKQISAPYLYSDKKLNIQSSELVMIIVRR